ncbi:hypothetical protein NQZ68_002264 [Dissostichus eleginoides]|nr:hypothetical protein NQZ68_002264 [Dissostichus eleginoides]
MSHSVKAKKGRSASKKPKATGCGCKAGGCDHWNCGCFKREMACSRETCWCDHRKCLNMEKHPELAADEAVRELMADGRLQLNNRRFGPGTRKYQKSSDLLLRKAPISRLISMSDFEVLQKKLRRALKVNRNNKVQNLSCPAGAPPSTPGTPPPC